MGPAPILQGAQVSPRGVRSPELPGEYQARYGGRPELARDGPGEVADLLVVLEQALTHGLREDGPSASLGLAVIRNVKELVTQRDFGPDTGGLWRLVSDTLHWTGDRPCPGAGCGERAGDGPLPVTGRADE